MAEKEKKPTEQEIRKATHELDSLLTNPELTSLMSELSEDRQLFGKMLANPRDHLKKRGVKLPDDVEVTLQQKALAVRLKITITVCVTFCIVIRGFVICRRTCVSGTIVLK